LSTTFLFYYQSFLFSAPLFCGAEDILALTDPFGKHYFHYFCFLFSGYYSLSQREKTHPSFSAASFNRRAGLMGSQHTPRRTSMTACLLFFFQLTRAGFTESDCPKAIKPMKRSAAPARQTCVFRRR
jgi:hypothetical protein